jgi:hemerythrin-like domain-containing protein
LVSEALLADPLAFLLAEHARQKVLLSHLDRLARNRVGRGKAAIAAALGAWFACELPLHLADEEQSLYPRLGATAATLLAALAEEDAVNPARRARLRQGLAALATGHVTPPGWEFCALDFVADYRRQIALEEQRLFPMARAVLGPGEQAAIRREMAARRV